jgi:predicted DNA-binding transcriptional regulator YafY
MSCILRHPPAMRASRLLTLLMLLQAHGRMSAPALAARLEASVRTIYRDIDELSAAGVPVVVERGAQGGFRLLDGWRTRLTGLTPVEAQALFLAGLPGPASQLGLGGARASAELKVLAALPAQWQEDARRVGSRFHLDPVGWYQDAARVDHLPAIAEAVWGEHRIAVRYESWERVVERVVEPLGLVLKAGEWYLVANADGKPRTYRLAKVLALKVRGDRFVRPRRFDLAAYWAESTARFEQGLWRGTATLRLSPGGLKRLRGMGAALVQAAERTRGAADARGWVEVELPVEGEEHAAAQFLRLGAEAEVLRPAALRARMLAAARAMAVLYEKKRPAPRRRPVKLRGGAQ